MIDKMLIMNPENADRLIGLLNYAIELLSLIQQPPMSTEEEPSKKEEKCIDSYIKLAEFTVDRIAQQLYTGLTGKVIIKTKEVKY